MAKAQNKIRRKGSERTETNWMKKAECAGRDTETIFKKKLIEKTTSARGGNLRADQIGLMKNY